VLLALYFVRLTCTAYSSFRVIGGVSGLWPYIYSVLDESRFVQKNIRLQSLLCSDDTLITDRSLRVCLLLLKTFILPENHPLANN